LTGEKKHEREEDEGNYHILERSRGYFSRTFQLPTLIDESKAEATLRDGVLKIILPKSAEAEAHRKKIEIKRE
jgi:HSP20 family protein